MALVVAGSLESAARAQEVPGAVAQPAPTAPAAPPSDPIPSPAAPELTQPSVTPEAPAATDTLGAALAGEQLIGDPSKTITPNLPGPAAPSPNPVHVVAIWQQSLGEGTFAVNPYVRNPLYAWWMSVRVRYDLPFGFAVSLRQDMDFEFTKTEWNTYNNQPLLGDTRLGVRNNYLKLPQFGIRTNVYVGYRAPISLESRFRRQLGSGEIGLSLDWSKWGFSVSVFGLAVAHARAWGKPQTATGNNWIDQWFMADNQSRDLQDRSGRVIPTQKCIARASEAASGGCPSVGALNGTVASGMGWFSLGYDLSALLDIPLSFSAGLVLMHAVTSYVSPDDKYRPQYARAGVTGNTFTWGLVSATYQFTDMVSLDVGIQSLQPLWSYDRGGQWVRFPFWNVPYWNLAGLGGYSGANNFSALYTSVTIAR